MLKNLFFIFGFFLVLPLAFAQPYGSGYGYGGGFFYGTERVIDSIVENLEPLLRALLGGYDWNGYLLFEKTLLFLLITIIVALVLENLPVFKGRTHKGILRLVAVIVGLLGVRWMNYVWVNTILVQYQVLFVAIAGILPFMIFWSFVKDFDSFVRKTAWSLYAVIYLGLWITSDVEAYTGVYLWGAIVGLVYGFFIDTPLQRWLALRAAKLGDNARRDAIIATLKKDIDEYKWQEAQGYLSKKSADDLIRRKTEVIRSLMKS